MDDSELSTRIMCGCVLIVTKMFIGSVVHHLLAMMEAVQQIQTESIDGKDYNRINIEDYENDY